MTEQSQLGPSRDGSVLLDIGGDVGALIIHTPTELLGAEIEISATADGSPRTHVAVRERHGPSGIRYAAIFPQLTCGTYCVWDLDGTLAQQITITGGSVTEIPWSTAR